MKHISLVMLALLFGIVISCRDEASDKYSGPSKLHFSEETARTEIILEGANYKDVVIPFGTVKALSSDASVKLVLDTENSTAVEGTQFQILNNPVKLSSGDFKGAFTVRVLETGVSSDTKTAVFKLSSTDVKNAVFNQTYKLDMSLFCPVDSFVGNFGYSGFWGTADMEIVEHPTKEKTLLIKDFLEDGTDIELTYDTNGNVSFEAQETGFLHSRYGMVTINPTKGKQSKFNTCNRTLTLYATYSVKAGSFSPSEENFIGK